MVCVFLWGKPAPANRLHGRSSFHRPLGLKPPIRTLTIKGKKYECSLKKGGQTKALLFNVLNRDCKPFVNRARVVGQRKGR